MDYKDNKSHFDLSESKREDLKDNKNKKSSWKI